jgi:hypothetical protein
MDTEVGTWANLFFGPTAVGIFRTLLTLELGKYGQALEAAKAVHPELLPSVSKPSSGLRSAVPWSPGRKPAKKGVHVLLHAKQLAPHRIRTDPVVREVVADLLRQSQRDAGGRELRGLAWRMGSPPAGERMAPLIDRQQLE